MEEVTCKGESVLQKHPRSLNDCTQKRLPNQMRWDSRSFPATIHTCTFSVNDYQTNSRLFPTIIIARV
uniref:Uncharacterized protein n=1 Tax=Pyxicephalus adspersus TaxID=30357 RepID=A0AAV3AFM6_PYXAD|nr:TPA: hypothetical protein GDO54_014134 [Pyxicephalus adspersus]